MYSQLEMPKRTDYAMDQSGTSSWLNDFTARLRQNEAELGITASNPYGNNIKNFNPVPQQGQSSQYPAISTGMQFSGSVNPLAKAQQRIQTGPDSLNVMKPKRVLHSGGFV